YGTVFSLTPATGGKFTQKVIYSFTGQGGDGANPEAGLVLSPKSGVLYGTTNAGGTAGYGTVFSLTPAAGGVWTPKVLYSFAGAPSGCGTTGNPACDGANPLGALTLSSSGALYGTTYGGGSVGWGTVFQLTQAAGVWSETVLYSFNGAPSGVNGGTACSTTTQPPCDGGAPAGNVVLNAATGALYGTTTLGGQPTGCPLGGYEQGCGVVFQLTPPTPPSTTWTESLLYTFAGPPSDGMFPTSNLVYAPTGGTLYVGPSPVRLRGTPVSRKFTRAAAWSTCCGRRRPRARLGPKPPWPPLTSTSGEAPMAWSSAPPAGCFMARPTWAALREVMARYSS